MSLQRFYNEMERYGAPPGPSTGVLGTARRAWNAARRIQQAYRSYRDRKGARQATMNRRRVMRGRVAKASDGATNIKARAIKKKGKSVKKEGRKRKIRVSRTFRKRVKAVLTSKGPNGISKEILPHAIIKPIDNQQTVVIPYDRSFNGTTGWHFSPTYIANVYEILYSKGAYAATAQTNISYNNTANLEIHVVEQYYQMRFKNLTARTLTVKLWDVSPKSIQETGYTTLDFLTNELLGTAPSTTPGVNLPGRENPSSVTLNTLGFTPKLVSAFNKNYTLDETVISLEPGKEYYHTVRGPNDKIYKYLQFSRNGVYRNQQTFTKQTIVCCYTDLVTDTLGLNVGRITDINGASPFGLLCETMDFVKIKCPDQTGYMAPSSILAGAVQPITQFGYAYTIKNWYQTQSGTIIDIEDENPQAQAVNGL